MEVRLTKQQQELVENNHNLIYKFAHQNKLSLDDYYDILAIGLCYAAKTYDENKNAFSTLAYTCMKNEIWHYWRKLHAVGAVPNEKIVSYDVHNALDSTCYNGGYISCIPDNNCICDITLSNIMYESFCELLTDKEKFITELLMNSIPQKEIAERMGITRQRVGQYIDKIRKKMMRYLESC